MLPQGRGKTERYSSVTGLIEAWLVKKFGETVGPWVLTLGGLFAVAILVIMVGYGIRSCYVRKQIKVSSAKVEAAKQDVIKERSKLEQIEKNVGEDTLEAERQAKVVKEAEEALVETVEKDSTTQLEDKQAAFQRFCRLYPRDARCL